MEDEVKISIGGSEKWIDTDDVMNDLKKVLSSKRNLEDALGRETVHEIQLDGSGFRAICPICENVHDMRQSKTTRHLDYSLDTFLPFWMKKHGSGFSDWVDDAIDSTDFRYLIDHADLEFVRAEAVREIMKRLDHELRLTHNVYFADCDSWIGYFYERSAIPHRAYRDGELAGIYRPTVEAHGKVFWEQPNAAWG